MTTDQRHLARRLTYDKLIEGLEAARADQAVYAKTDPKTGLQLWAYTNSCFYDRKWNEFSMIARGLVTDPARRLVVAAPFPKFFNYGERSDGLPDEPFEVFEKLDGSLIILFHHEGRWRTTTKGTCGAPQAV